MIFGFSGYSRRRLGAGTQEYSSILLATTATAGTTAFFAYLTWTNVPRDYYLPVFGVGLACLGVWRYTARRIVRAMRVRNAYVVPTVVLGGRRRGRARAAHLRARRPGPATPSRASS